MHDCFSSSDCLTNDGNFDYAYDTENHLLSSMNVDVWQFYGYDPFHRQTERTVWIVDPVKTRYLYSGWQRIEDYSSDTGDLQNRYVYGNGLDEPLIQVSSTGDLTFLHANHQGSIIATSNDTGAVVDKNAYGPFGESVAHSGTTFGFTGQRFDAESGLYYYKRRYYSPAIGRFLQPDPIGYQIEAACGCTCDGGCSDDATPSQLNLYAYVENDTLNSQDPLGLEPIGTTLLRPVHSPRATGPYPVSPWSGELNPYLGPGKDRLNPYHIPPNLHPDLWEPELEFNPKDPGYMKCIDDLWEKYAKKCFKSAAEAQAWIKAESKRCREKFTRPTGNWRDREGNWIARYDPRTKQWTYNPLS